MRALVLCRDLGLLKPDDVGRSAPATVGEALREARRNVFAFKKESSSWGAYQHYGRASDRLLAPSSPEAPAEASVFPAANKISSIHSPSQTGVPHPLQEWRKCRPMQQMQR